MDKKVLEEKGLSKIFSDGPISFHVPDDVVSFMESLARKGLKSFLDSVNIVRYDFASQNVPYIWRKIAVADEDGHWKSVLLCDRDVEDYSDSFASLLVHSYSALGKGFCIHSSSKKGKVGSAGGQVLTIRLENSACSCFLPSLENDDILDDEDNLVELEFTFLDGDNSFYVTASVHSPFHSTNDLLSYYRGIRFWSDKEAQSRLFSCVNSGAMEIRTDDGVVDGLILYCIPQRENGILKVSAKVFTFPEAAEESYERNKLFWALSSVRIIGSGVDGGIRLPNSV